VILRGSNSGPNYDAESVDQTIRGLEKESLNTHIMIDCSHGNSQKKFKNQMNVANSLVRQGGGGGKNIFIDIIIFYRLSKLEMEIATFQE
jgi:3-deoxy-7-phosphoheptulonate synthase